MGLDVFFRSCSRVEAVNKTPRPMGVRKSELSLRCLASLLNSMKQSFANGSDLGESQELSLTIIDDHSDSEFIKAVKSMLSHCEFTVRFQSMEGHLSGNGASLNMTYQLARELSHELIYFVEDDYLHHPQSIQSMINGFKLGTERFGKDVCIFPCDYIDLYRQPQVSKILLAKDRYWRSIISTTGTVMVTKKILESHWSCFMGLARYDLDPGVNEGNTINLVYKDYPCLSPMPSLAIHMHEGMESPFADWRRWWQEVGPLAMSWSRPRSRSRSRQEIENVGATLP